jgi:beta-lactam-binding protein with PASTA domain
MRNFLRWTLRAFVVVLVGITSMLITMRMVIHGREVPIPKFVGMTAQDADKLASANGLTLVLENRFFSNDFGEGRILSQVPQPGVKVRRGWRVRIAQSMGPQRIMIPSVLGESPRAAELNVRRRGLELGTIAGLPIADQPTGDVIAQSPPPDARGIASPKISLLVAAPPEEAAFVMPDLTGLKLDQASAAITAAGLKVGTVTKAREAGTNGTATGDTVVIRHFPAPGQRVPAGSSINLELGNL